MGIERRVKQKVLRLGWYGIGTNAMPLVKLVLNPGLFFIFVKK
jgi:hypothetical protein